MYTKKDVRKLLREIKKDGYIIHLARIQSAWIDLFGTPGCSHYPYTTLKDQLEDLEEYVR